MPRHEYNIGQCSGGRTDRLHCVVVLAVGPLSSACGQPSLQRNASTDAHALNALRKIPFKLRSMVLEELLFYPWCFIHNIVAAQLGTKEDNNGTVIRGTVGQPPVDSGQ